MEQLHYGIRVANTSYCGTNRCWPTFVTTLIKVDLHLMKNVLCPHCIKKALLEKKFTTLLVYLSPVVELGTNNELIWKKHARPHAGNKKI